MRTSFFLLPATVLALALGACERKPSGEVTLAKPEALTRTLETDRLDKAIDAYEATPSAENKAAADKALADLDGEIAELEARVAKTSGGDKAEATTKRDHLRSYRDKQAARLAAFRTKAGAATPTSEQVRHTGEKVGDKLERGAEKAGDALENLGRKANDKLKDATQ